MEPNKAQGETVLELDVEELENAIKHLRRSNAEMKEYCKTQQDTTVFLDAIQENLRAIQNKQAKILELKQLLGQGKNGGPMESPADRDDNSLVVDYEMTDKSLTL